ncbi:TPA: methionine--tRNA ligase [Patescibacteria group bacterium]|nr:methionine--tRNA ligase [Patescibacteria group bacterium]
MPRFRKILVAAAWPYVNGSLHLGHVAGLLPADIIARYHRQHGDDVLFVSGSDCHGTPILNTAEKEGVSPQVIAERYHQEAVDMLINRLGFSYSLYTKTMGDFHKSVAQTLFQEIYDNDCMVAKEEDQFFCVYCNRFLPDRFIEGTCPNCGATGARGDQCDSCSKLHDAKDLLQPTCKICNNTPVLRRSKHLYFRLPLFQDRLDAWMLTVADGWRENAITTTRSALLDQGLKDRPVTRDLSWGIPVPVEGFREKCIYVWFEAVMGYFSCSREYSVLQNTPEAWRDWWENDQAIHYYVHGKDNIPFHTIIWPAMLMALNLHLPDKIISSEYLNFEGLKFSKSKGIAIWLPEALAKFDPETIRFYLTLNGPETKDVSFRWNDFRERVNADLIGTLGNFWQRTFAMITQNFDAIPSLQDYPADNHGTTLLQKAATTFEIVSQAIEQGNLRTALSEVLDLAKAGNIYLNQREPWKMAKTNRNHAGISLAVCAAIGDALRRLVAPFIPQPIERLNSYLGTTDLTWRFAPYHLGGKQIIPPSVLIRKIEKETIKEEIDKMQRADSD